MTCVIGDLNIKDIVGTFYKKNYQKKIKQSLELKKVIKKKGHKLFVKREGYVNLFNSWIDKKDVNI